MPRFSRDPLRKMISLRVTEEDDQLLSDLAERLQLPGGKADLLRKALDYWLEHAPEAQEASRHAKGKKEKG